jgi:hypothetical protein
MQLRRNLNFVAINPRNVDRTGGAADAECEISVDGQGAAKFRLRRIADGRGEKQGKNSRRKAWSIHGGVLRRNVKLMRMYYRNGKVTRNSSWKVPRKLTPHRDMVTSSLAQKFSQFAAA